MSQIQIPSIHSLHKNCLHFYATFPDCLEAMILEFYYLVANHFFWYTALQPASYFLIPYWQMQWTASRNRLSRVDVLLWWAHSFTTPYLLFLTWLSLETSCRINWLKFLLSCMTARSHSRLWKFILYHLWYLLLWHQLVLFNNSFNGFLSMVFLFSQYVI